MGHRSPHRSRVEAVLRTFEQRAAEVDGAALALLEAMTTREQ